MARRFYPVNDERQLTNRILYVRYIAAPIDPVPRDEPPSARGGARDRIAEKNRGREDR